MRDSPAVVLDLEALGTDSAARRQAETLLVVGQGDEAPEYLFDRIRDGILTDDGFWVADGGSNEIRFYSFDGSFRFAIGGSGSGPGEFTSLTRIFLVEPDSLLAFDANGRVTEFGGERQVVRTFDVPWLEGRREATQYTLLGSRKVAVLIKTPRDPRERLGETVRDTVELMLLDTSTPEFQRTGIRLADRWWTYRRTESSFSATSPPDGPSALLAALGTRVVTSTAERRELHLWTTDLYNSGEPAEMAVASETAAADSVRPRAIDQLIQSDDGGLWVGFHAADQDPVREWVWINGGGEVAAQLQLPKDAWVLDVQAQQFLVRAADSDGNQNIQLLTIR